MFLSAPTGAEKSLTFELAPYAFDRLLGEDCNAIVFIIVPLISPIATLEDLVFSLNCRGIRASYVGNNCSKQELKDILNLKTSITFCINWCLEVPRRFSTTINTFFVY